MNLTDLPQIVLNDRDQKSVGSNAGDPAARHAAAVSKRNAYLRSQIGKNYALIEVATGKQVGEVGTQEFLEFAARVRNGMFANDFIVRPV